MAEASAWELFRFVLNRAGKSDKPRRMFVNWEGLTAMGKDYHRRTGRDMNVDMNLVRSGAPFASYILPSKEMVDVVLDESVELVRIRVKEG